MFKKVKDKIDLHGYNEFKQGLHNIRQARRIIFQEQGFKALLNRRYISLGIKSLIPLILPAFIALTVFSLLCYIWLFTMVVPIYWLYSISAVISLIFNVPITIANALLYAGNAVFQLIKAGLLTILNAFLAWALKPVAIVLNTIIGAITPIVNAINAIGGFFGVHVNMGYIDTSNIIPQKMINMDFTPKTVFAYVMPANHVNVDANGQINLLSVFSFVFVKPGAPLYMHDANNEIILNEYAFGDEPPLTLVFPKINPDAIANGLITTPYKPPPGSVGTQAFTPDVEGYSWITITLDKIKQRIAENTARDLWNPVADSDNDGKINMIDPMPTVPQEKLTLTQRVIVYAADVFGGKAATAIMGGIGSLGRHLVMTGWLG